jgi:signal transduction histidine kinase
LERRVEERTAELEKALQVKREFLSRASHELRTPMNHILGFAQLLSLKKGLTEKQEASVRTNFRKWPEALDADRSHPRNFKGGSKRANF